MQFLTLSRRHEGAATPPDAEAVKAEVRRARALYAEGRIRQLWHRADGPGACVLWEAGSEAEVRLMIESLPLFLAGQVEVTIVPLCPWAGFAPNAAF
jgi:muconolactone delta-isomerase